MISQVFETLKSESRKGDFVHLTNGDRSDLNIDLDIESIKSFSKKTWKHFVDQKIKNAAFLFVIEENSRKENTKDIIFQSLKMSDYFKENKRKSLSNIIFNIRSKNP